jgi:hypothetical protein
LQSIIIVLHENVSHENGFDSTFLIILDENQKHYVHKIKITIDKRLHEESVSTLSKKEPKKAEQATADLPMAVSQ